MIFLLILIFFYSSFANNNLPKPEYIFNENEITIIDNLRKLYYKAVEDDKHISDLENFINFSLPQSEKFYFYRILYLGGLEAVKSKHAFWPLKKLNYLKASMKYLNQSIKIDSENLEARFMRFSILHYVPSFLGYGNEREEDAKEIFNLLINKKYDLINKEILIGIYEFMISSERLDINSTKKLKYELSTLK